MVRPTMTAGALAALLALALAGAGLAAGWEGSANVGVEVKDRSGQPLAGAKVALVRESVATGPAPLLTDAEGRASFSGLAEGEWRVEVSHPDFMAFTAYVELRTGKEAKSTFAAQVATHSSWAVLRVAYYKPRGPAGRRLPQVVATPAASPAATAATAPAGPAPPPAAPPAAAPPSAAPPPPAMGSPAPGAAPVASPTPSPITPRPVATSPAPVPAPVVSPTPPPLPPPQAVPAPAPPAAVPSAAPPQTAPTSVPTAPPEPTPRPVPAPPAPAPAPPVVPPLAPAPQPAVPVPPAPRPAPATAPSPSPNPPPADLRTSVRGNCPECRGGEWGLAAEASASAGSGCPADAAATVQTAIRQLAAAPGVAGRYGALDADGRLVIDADPATAAALEPFLAPSSGCRLLALVLPPGARFLGYRYEASDASGSGDCLAGQDCAIGGCGFPAHAAVARGPQATLIWTLFANRDPQRGRRAHLIAYFRPAPGWAP